MGRTRRNRKGGGLFKSKPKNPFGTPKGSRGNSNSKNPISNLRKHLSETLNKLPKNSYGRTLTKHKRGNLSGINNANPKPGEIEVFRIILKEGKCYEYIEATRKHSHFDTYYSTNKYKYVGKFVKTQRFGTGNGSGVTEIFDNNGEKVEVKLSYEGMSCFKEVDCK